MRDTLTVYYNGACPICGAEIRHYQALASRSAAPLAWVDIDRQPDALEAHAICGDMAKRRLYAKLQDGSLVAGVAAFALLWQRLPRYRWLGGVATAPLVRPVA